MTVSENAAKLPFAEKAGVFGELVLNYGFLVYVAVIIALSASFFLNRTRKGLQLRAVGENPATADAAGINVGAYKYWATCIGSMIAGLMVGSGVGTLVLLRSNRDIRDNLITLGLLYAFGVAFGMIAGVLPIF